MIANTATPLAPIWVMGAGAIGCFVGGRLQAAGLEVQFIGRPRLGQELKRHGLRLSDLEAPPQQLQASAIRWHDAVPTPGPGLAAPGLVLLCVKSLGTAAAAAELALSLPDGTPVLSLQNGVDNAAVAQAAALSLKLIPGMVPFNVAALGEGRFHRGTTGRLAAKHDAALQPYLPAFAAAGLALSLHADMQPVLWAKLLLNLNNPVNALSGLPLREQLLNPGWRRCTAALMDEALAALQAADIQPAQLTPLPAAAIPKLMRAPTPLFRLAAASMLRVDAQARSSMADDLARGRPTEIDALCGAVVRLGRLQRVPTPRNEAMLALMAERRPVPLAELQVRLGLSA